MTVTNNACIGAYKEAYLVPLILCTRMI